MRGERSPRAPRELHLERHRATREPGVSQPSRHCLGVSGDGRGDRVAIEHVFLERVLLPARLHRAIGLDRSLVEPARQIAKLEAARPQDLLRAKIVEAGEIAYFPDAGALEPLCGDRSHSPEFSHRQRGEERSFLTVLDRLEAVRLRERARDFGDELARGDAHADGEPGRLSNPQP